MWIKRTIWLILLLFTAACAANQPDEAVQTATMLPISAPLTLPSSTPTRLPPTPSSTPTPSPTLAPTISPSVVEGLRMAYMIDGNLYLQDGTNPPVQLTNDERRDHTPVFSVDGEKIVFLRGLIPYDLYSINPDGSQEQLLVSGSVLSRLGLEYDEVLTEIHFFDFIPGTHQLIFSTHELDEHHLEIQSRHDLIPLWNSDLLLVDADTAEIRRLLPPGECYDFVIAPTGNMIAVLRHYRIDIVDLSGRIIRQNLFTYTPTEPDPLVPDIFWREDAAELFVTLPIGTEHIALSGPEVRTLWRIAIAGSSRTQISFDPPLVSTEYYISPDGNWILYNYYYYPGKTDESITAGLYLGNLIEGDSQLVVEGYVPGHWSPDSFHFLYEGLEWGLGTTDGQSDPVAIQYRLFGWIDDSHFIYFDDYQAEYITMGGIDGSMINIPFYSTVNIYVVTFSVVYSKSNP